MDEIKANIGRSRSASTAILYQLSEQGRLVLSDWRAMVFLRRATFSLAPSQRRWSIMPSQPRQVWPLLSRMLNRGELEPIPGVRHFYRASVPYARERVVDEREVLMEIHPYAALGHFSALFYHGLTEAMPNVITAIVPSDGKGGQLPPDTDADDWAGIRLPQGRKVPKVLGWPVRWRSIKPARYSGIRLYRNEGFPIRVTTPERTLVDGLRDPELSGSLENVLRAWAIASDSLDVDEVIHNVELLGESVLRQRVGFVLEKLGLTHPTLREWRRNKKRGGSSKLLASAPYAPEYDENWDLSINAPIDAINTPTANIR
jgi:predicted transcriptional regulator of viral defense system